MLSACETGLGSVVDGEGVLGLQRASSISAGAQAVVASLWKVDDAATSVLMEEFYANLWRKDEPAIQAGGFATAQLKVLRNPGLVEKRRRELGLSPETRAPGTKPEPMETAAPAWSDPSLWAAFVLSGDIGPLRRDSVAPGNRPNLAGLNRKNLGQSLNPDQLRSRRDRFLGLRLRNRGLGSGSGLPALASGGTARGEHRRRSVFPNAGLRARPAEKN